MTLESLGITATAEEINILDGVVISSTILNYLEGVRSNVQEQIDNKSSNTHTHNIEFNGIAASTSQGAEVASATHTHTYEHVTAVENSGAHQHNVEVPTQTFEQDGAGKYVLVFGVQTVNTSEIAAHTHNLISKTINTTAPSEVTEVASKEHTHEVTGSGTTGTPHE